MLDIDTLAFILSFTSILQAVVIYIEFKNNRNYPGIFLWVLAYLFSALGALSMGIRAYFEIGGLFIIMSNAFTFFAIMLLYLGIVRFLGHKEDLKILVIMSTIFFTGVIYYTYFNDSTNDRIILYSFAVSILSFICGKELLINKKFSVEKTSNIKIAVIFIMYSAFMLLRGGFALVVNLNADFFSPTAFQVLTFVVTISVSYLWSFGLITMILEREKEEKSGVQQRLRLMFEMGPDIMFISNIESGKIIEVNEKFVFATGYSKEEVIGKTTTEINIWANKEERNKFVNILKRDGVFDNYEMIMKKKNGESFTGLLSARIMNLDGSPHIISVARDITNTKMANDKLRSFSLAIEQSPVSIILTDLKGNIEYVNKKFLEVTGYSIEEVIGKNPKILKSGVQTTDFYKELWETILSGKEWKGEFHNKRKNGELFWERASISPIINENGEVAQILAVKEDITESKRLEEELQHQARTDMLTGISNRRFFIQTVENILKEYIEEPKEAAFLMMDIDHFKAVNDTYGHAAGDVALKTIADECKKHLRKADAFGRIGGEEFAVFLGDTEYGKATEIAERLRESIENVVLLDSKGERIQLRMSIGITKYKINVDSIEEIMARADRALYRAKNEGRNRVVSVE